MALIDTIKKLFKAPSPISVVSATVINLPAHCSICKLVVLRYILNNRNEIVCANCQTELK